MRQAAKAEFRLIAEGKGSAAARVFELHPVPVSRSFLAATMLLGGLFGAPALAVALDPARRDPWSLGAAACGLGILGFAALAGWRAVSGRRRQRITLRADGIATPSDTYAWPEIAGFLVLLPSASSLPSAPVGSGAGWGEAVAGSHGLGARIGQRQQAGATQIALQLGAGRKPAILATGLDEATANRLQAALEAVAMDYGWRPAVTMVTAPPGEGPRGVVAGC